MESQINVTVRIKPTKATPQCWHRVKDNTLQNAKTKELYSFDDVYDQDASTKQIFDQSVKSLVHNALIGINQTVFAYG